MQDYELAEMVITDFDLPVDTCVFRAKDVRALIQHAPKGATSIPVFFVHDQGIYLMLNEREIPGFHVEDRPENEEAPRQRPLAYALGTNPEQDTQEGDMDWWEYARELVGGDDFAESLTLEGELLAELVSGQPEWLCIVVSEDTLEIALLKN